jgi:CotH kinase protein/Lamin Tail Domain/Immunoglobulin domain/Chitobiase/beta-hexosaminidase C-terminal domain/Bacterial TSP3 repeat
MDCNPVAQIAPVALLVRALSLLISIIMKLRIVRFLSLSLWLCLSAGTAAAADLIPAGAPGWKYLLGTQEASSPVAAWRDVGFNDAAWTVGPAPIGYDGGATGTLTPIATTLPSSTAGNYLSVYFRKSFTVSDPARVADLALTLYVDDGAVAWLNGTEVARVNVAAGDLPFNATATVADETRVTTTTNIASLLLPGNNVLCVHVFNGNLGSSDLVFDASLSGNLDLPPTVANLDPAADATLVSLTLINVVFNEPVSGVNASDLLINTVPATNLFAVSPIEYIFSFPQPATGVVAVAWAGGHGIADLDQTPDPFAGGSWSYTLNTNAPVTPAMISEFLANNNNGISDEDGTRSDWIEIYNPGPADLNLDGWFLTDLSTDLTKWRLPSINLNANKYLLVWASEKNRTNPAAPLHTNFKLDAGGEYLALVDRNTNVVSAFSPVYPSQLADVSYGRVTGNPNSVGFFTTPTPGAQNSTSGSGFASEPGFSLASGIYTNNSLTLTLTSPPLSVIRYTFDGSVPTTGSPGGASPLNITFTTNMIIQVRVFQTNQPSLFPSPVVSRTFIMLDSTTQDFSSDLPLMVISTQGRAIQQNLPPGSARQRGIFTTIDTFQGRSALRGKLDFQGLAGFEIIGQTSAGFPKKPHRVELQDELGNDSSASLLGLPAEADWNLRNPYSDKCLMNDFLAYELWEDMGHYSCRRRLVEMFVDTGGGKLTYPNDYYGVMVLFERIEQGKDRVDIKELTLSNTNEPSISGGYIIKKDKDSAGDTAFSTTGGAGHSGQTLKFHEPKPRNISIVQSNWIRNYVQLFENSMYAANWTNATGTNHYSHYIDVDQFVDQQLHVEFTKQIDGYRLSDYFSKERNGKLRPEPIWDWNLSFGNGNYLKGGMTNGWYWADSAEGMNSAEHIWLRRLVFGAPTGPTSDMPSGSGSGDQNFRQKITDRWAVLRTNVLNGDRIVARINQIATQLTEAAGRNYQKYPILNDTTIWPNPQGAPFHVDYSQPTYALIISNMTFWTKGRYLWMDNQFLKTPLVSYSGGPIAAGTPVTLTAPGATIYYTLNGVDPRASGGGIAPGAQIYSGPITVNANSRLIARAFLNSLAVWTPWSGPVDATYVVQTPPLVLTEIMYNPADPLAGSTNSAQDFEYLEFRNLGVGALNVGGFRISSSVDFTFPSLSVPAGGRVLVVGNLAAFSSRYNTNGLLIAGQFTGDLGNDGSRLVVEGSLREPIHDFSYDDDWYPITDGPGFSLQIVNENAALNTWGLMPSWRPSGVFNGTPGVADPGPASPAVVYVNEVLSNTDPVPGDAIELRNPNGSDVNIGGWFLTDNFGSPKKFRIPDNTMIAANGYLVFYQSNSFGMGANGFALSSAGEDVYLFSGDANTNLTGYVHGFDFGPQASGVTFGRHVISTGADHFVAQTSGTLGGANSGPLVGPVIVSEISYHPVDVFNSYGTFDNQADEYIELRNLSGSPAPLFDPGAQTNRWRLRDAVDFTFPPNTSIPANGYILITAIDPADATAAAGFRSRNGVPGNIPLYGPYKGQLDNSGESVELVRPDVPVLGVVNYILVDRVNYKDLLPWPEAADGIGPTLHRVTASAYGNDPANWAAAPRSPGSAYVAGNPPNITQQPANATAFVGGQVMFSVAASGSGLSYQWRRNGTVLPAGTNSVLSLSFLQSSQAGLYDCVVQNASGASVSTKATLTVIIAATISQHPADRDIRVRPDPLSDVAPTTNATFTVVASSQNPPLTYQWRFHGTNLPGATSSTLTVSNVTMDHFGPYSCLVSDAVGSIVSSNATLYPLVRPLVWLGPVNQTVPAGSAVPVSVVLSNGFPPPFGYQWRSNTLNIATPVSNSKTNFFVIPQFYVPTNAVTVPTYRVIITNRAVPSFQVPQSASFTLTTVLDTDKDGIADTVETALGLDVNNPADALLDLDGDGMSNLAEVQAGTNPNDVNSFLRIELGTMGTMANITVAAVSNRTYSVQYSDALPASWTTLASLIARPTNRVELLKDPDWTTNRFYRLTLPAQ